MATGMKCSANPPEFQEDNSSYEEYRKEVQIWQLLKICSKKAEGPLIFRTLKGRAKSVALELSVEEIGSDNGLELIMEKLDKLYLTEKNQRIFLALDEFENFKRSDNGSMSDFIIEFERCHNKVVAFECTYPDGVLAYRLLKAANLSSQNEQLCRATIGTGEWSYKSMLSQLKKIFTDIPSDSAVKLENVMHTYGSKQSSTQYDTQEDYDFESGEYEVYNGPNNWKRGQQRWRPNMKQGEYRGYRGNNNYNQRRPYLPDAEQYTRGGHNINPRNSRGNITKCRKCKSVLHWIGNCPHATSEERRERSDETAYHGGEELQEELYIGLLQSTVPTSKNELIYLVGETLGMAVIDSGCSKTVCGLNWYTAYMESLSEGEKAMVRSTNSRAKFMFGDTIPSKSLKRVYIPIKLMDQQVMLETEVVKNDIPLLLSKESMKRGRAKIDFTNDTIDLSGKVIPLVCTSSGHYAIHVTDGNIQKNQQEKIDGNSKVKKVRLVARGYQEEMNNKLSDVQEQQHQYKQDLHQSKDSLLELNVKLQSQLFLVQNKLTVTQAQNNNMNKEMQSLQLIQENQFKENEEITNKYIDVTIKNQQLVNHNVILQHDQDKLEGEVILYKETCNRERNEKKILEHRINILNIQNSDPEFILKIERNSYKERYEDANVKICDLEKNVTYEAKGLITEIEQIKSKTSATHIQIEKYKQGNTSKADILKVVETKLTQGNIILAENKEKLEKYEQIFTEYKESMAMIELKLSNALKIIKEKDENIPMNKESVIQKKQEWEIQVKEIKESFEISSNKTLLQDLLITSLECNLTKQGADSTDLVTRITTGTE